MISLLNHLTNVVTEAEKKISEYRVKLEGLVARELRIAEHELDISGRLSILAERTRIADERDKKAVDIEKARRDGEALRLKNQEDRRKIVDDQTALKEAQDKHALAVKEFEDKQAIDAAKLAKEWRIIDDKKQKMEDEIVKRVKDLMSKVRKDAVA